MGRQAKPVCIMSTPQPSPFPERTEIAMSSDVKEFYEHKQRAYENVTDIIGERERRILKWFPAAPNVRVFDVACGSGRFLRKIKSMGHQGIGIELSDRAVQLCRQSGIDVYQGNIEAKADLARAGAPFDVITLID